MIKYLKYKDLPYKYKQINGNIHFKSKSTVRSYSTLTLKNTKLYDNCLMENIDGTVMSTCSNRKVDWYAYEKLLYTLANLYSFYYYI